RGDGSEHQCQPHDAVERRRARPASAGPRPLHPPRPGDGKVGDDCRPGGPLAGKGAVMRFSGFGPGPDEGDATPPWLSPNVAGPRLVADNQGLAGRGLGKSFKRRPVLRDVNVSVQRGEVVGLLGPNGAGKTTCFYIITGLITADTGQVTLDGEDITGLPMYRRARRGIGYLPQEASIFRGLTVEQNIRAILEVAEPDPDVREQMLDALLAEFSISHLRRAAAMALSGGERRRCEIARALATQPHFILLDEPLAGIDPIAVNDIR